jgi:flagellar basal body-associated protein FliL
MYFRKTLDEKEFFEETEDENENINKKDNAKKSKWLIRFIIIFIIIIIIAIVLVLILLFRNKKEMDNMDEKESIKIRLKNWEFGSTEDINMS